MKQKRPIITLLSIMFGVTSGMSIAKNNEDLDVSGYVMFGYDLFDASLLEDALEGESPQSLSGIRRARLSVKSDIDESWKSKFQLDFTGGETEIKDAYLEYDGWTFADLTIGKQKEGFGLEKVTSSRNLLMIERSIISETLAPGRSLGVSLSGKLLRSLNWQFGYYKPDTEESTSAVTGRVTWVPWQKDENLLHLGFAFSERECDGNEFRVNEKLEVYTSDSILEGDRINADNISLQGLEMLWVQDRLTFMAEWQQSLVNSLEQTAYEYEGGYLQFSYQLTDGYRKYKNGKLGDSSQSGWELTGRYSDILLKTENKNAQTYALGLNYKVDKNIKFMADYIKAEYFDAGISTNKGDSISLRVQYSF